VHSMVDFFLLLMLAGAGDELQGIKKGIVEMAHGLVINKADGENEGAARRARGEYKRALHLLAAAESGWQVPVLTCSALEQRGMAEVAEMLTAFQAHHQPDGWWARNRQAQALQWMQDAIRFELEDRFQRDEGVRAARPGLATEVEAGRLPPTIAAQRLIRLYLQGADEKSAED